MKRLKNISLFKIVLLFLINVYLNNIYFFIISLLYLFFINKLDSLLLIVLLMLNYLLSLANFNLIKIGYIEDARSTYVIVNKVLYKEKVYITNAEYGDIVLTSNSQKSSDLADLKKNIKYISYDEIKILKDDTLVKRIYKKINNSDAGVVNLYKKILLNEYVSDLDLDFYLGYGLCVYYLLKKIFNKNKYLGLASLFIYSLLFGFEIKLILIILDFILSFLDIDSLNKLSIKMLIIGYINIYLFFNYSLLLTFIFMFLNLTSYANNRLIISIIQSLLFGQIQLLTSFFFNFYINIRIFMFIICLISLFIPFLNPIYLFMINIISTILKIINISIRGKVSLIILSILLILKIFKIKNNYIYLIVLFICLLLPINNPFKHVSFIDVGQGDSILIKGYLNSYNVLIDTGSTYNYSKLKKYLFNEGIYKLDYLIISHNDSDHNGNITSLKKDFKIDNIITSPIDIEIKDLYLKNYYLGYFDNDNDNSLIYLANINDLNFLFVGDISKNIERLLVNNYDLKDIDVLKVSHHGSKTGSDKLFISNLLPDFAIISTNGNYGHPHKETLETLNDYLVNIYSTKEKGTISFYFVPFNKFIKTNNEYLILS